MSEIDLCRDTVVVFTEAWDVGNPIAEIRLDVLPRPELPGART